MKEGSSGKKRVSPKSYQLSYKSFQICPNCKTKLKVIRSSMWPFLLYIPWVILFFTLTNPERSTFLLEGLILGFYLYFSLHFAFLL